MYCLQYTREDEPLTPPVIKLAAGDVSRKAAADQIPAANYGHLEVPRPKQDVVSIDIVPDHIPEQQTASQMLNSHLDNSHTIEVAMKDITVRISNDADPVLLTRTFRLLQELSC